MPLVDVGPQVSADVCKGDGKPWEGGQKLYFLQSFFMDEPVSHNLSRNLSRKNAKP